MLSPKKYEILSLDRYCLINTLPILYLYLKFITQKLFIKIAIIYYIYNW